MTDRLTINLVALVTDRLLAAGGSSPVTARRVRSTIGGFEIELAEVQGALDHLVEVEHLSLLDDGSYRLFAPPN